MLYGSILQQTPSAILFQVATSRGDARQWNIVGQHWLKKKDITITRRALGTLDRVECSAALLEQLGKGSDPLTVES